MKLLRFLAPVSVLILATLGMVPMPKKAGNYLVVKASGSSLNKTPSSQAELLFHWGGALTTTAAGAVPLMMEEKVFETIKFPHMILDKVLCSYSKPFMLTAENRTIGVDVAAHFTVAPIGDYENHATRHQGDLSIRFAVVDAESETAIVGIKSLHFSAPHGQRLDTTTTQQLSVDLRQHAEQLRPYYGKPLKLQAFLMASPFILTSTRANTSQSVTIVDAPPRMERSGSNSKLK